jgi:hypothetical protein
VETFLDTASALARQVVSVIRRTFVKLRAYCRATGQDAFRERVAKASRSLFALIDSARRSSADIDGSRI